MKKIFIALLLFGTVQIRAHAAQVGEVIVNEAKVFLYPQSGSHVITTVKKGESMAVSNLPTEGFYKARLPNGDMGWISGNDILAKSANAPNSAAPVVTPAPKRETLPAASTTPATPSNRMKRKPPAKRGGYGEEETPEEDSSVPSDHLRILLGAGAQSLNYTGLSANYEKTSLLNPGVNFGIEFQIQIWEWLHWAARVDAILGNTKEQTISTGAKQTITVTNVPAQLGLVASPILTTHFRFSLGVYAGASVVSSASIHQPALGDINYSSVAPCAMGSAQIAYGFGRHFALFVEGGYRYQKTGDLPATKVLGAIPSFIIDYSGAMGKAGIELKF